MKTNQARGLTVEVLRSNGIDCTAGGISSNHDRLTVVGHYVDNEETLRPLDRSSQVFEPRDTAPAVALHVRGIGGERNVTVVPVEVKDGHYVPTKKWIMAGGNYATLGDSRLTELVRSLIGNGFYGALNIHDRIEIN